MPGQKKKQKSIRQVQAEVRDAKILKLRLQGKTTREIAPEIGVSQPRIQQLLNRIMKRLAEERHDLSSELRSLTEGRLDALLSANWEKALGGSKDAQEMCLKIIDRQMKLHGLEAPPQVNVTNNTLNLVQLPPEELFRRARMVGIDVSDLERLPHEPVPLTLESLGGSVADPAGLNTTPEEAGRP